MTGWTKNVRDRGAETANLNRKRKAEKNRTDYQDSPKFCKNFKCGTALTYEQFKGRRQFCSYACSNIHRAHSLETKRKISLSVKKFAVEHPKPKLNIKRKCLYCNKIFIIESNKKINRKTCSSKCAHIYGSRKASEVMKANGTRQGWQVRNGQPSYPEAYLISVFENENICGWVREKHVHKWFIDFAFEDRMLAVEMDGNQHEDPKRKANDKEKDAYLSSQGWKVLRIKWASPNSDRGKAKLHPQIKNLLNILKD